MTRFRYNKKTQPKYIEIVSGLWQNDFKTELEIGETYRHNKYGDIKILRIFIAPSVKSSGWFLFWRTVRTSYDVQVVFSYNPPGSLGALTGRELRELLDGLAVQTNFDNEVKKRVSALSKE